MTEQVAPLTLYHLSTTRDTDKTLPTHPELERSDALGAATPQLMNELSIPLGHHTLHAQGVGPAQRTNQNTATRVPQARECTLHTHTQKKMSTNKALNNVLPEPM